MRFLWLCATAALMVLSCAASSQAAHVTYKTIKMHSRSPKIKELKTGSTPTGHGQTNISWLLRFGNQPFQDNLQFELQVHKNEDGGSHLVFETEREPYCSLSKSSEAGQYIRLLGLYDSPAWQESCPPQANTAASLQSFSIEDEDIGSDVADGDLSVGLTLFDAGKAAVYFVVHVQVEK